jgi:uncharacterized protein (DUF1499 family)
MTAMEDYPMSASDAITATVGSSAPPGPLWKQLAWGSVALAAACALAELFAGPGHRLGWWAFGIGIQTIRWAATVAAAVCVLAALAAVLAQRRKLPQTRAVFLAAAVLALVAAAPPTYFWYLVQHLPRMHDITTDTANPPQYVSVLPLRQGARNPTEYDPKAAAQQREGYPDIAPVILESAPAQTFAHAERVARSMGWEMVAVVPTELRIEATATSFLFGFKDDIVIRITPSGSGSRIDMRSLSRVGGSDFGVNASRVRTFVKGMMTDAAV